MRATITMPIETLAKIIAKARAWEAALDEDELEGEEEIDEEEADEDEPALLADDDDAGLSDDDLTELLSGLSDNQLAELLALIWIGGGDYGEEDWDEALSRARALGEDDMLAQFQNADDLADLIADGLAELGYTVVIDDESAAA